MAQHGWAACVLLADLPSSLTGRLIKTRCSCSHSCLAHLCRLVVAPLNAAGPLAARVKCHWNVLGQRQRRNLPHKLTLTAGPWIHGFERLYAGRRVGLIQGHNQRMALAMPRPWSHALSQLRMPTCACRAAQHPQRPHPPTGSTAGRAWGSGRRAGSRNRGAPAAGRVGRTYGILGQAAATATQPPHMQLSSLLLPCRSCPRFPTAAATLASLNSPRTPAGSGRLGRQTWRCIVGWGRCASPPRSTPAGGVAAVAGVVKC